MNSVKRFYVLLICLVIGLIAGGCTYDDNADELSIQNTTGEKILRPGDEPVRTEIKLYFRNNNYSEKDPESLPVIPVTRSFHQDELTARAVLAALISGPSAGEELQYGAGPVIDATDLQIEDVYIKNKICVIHLQSSHSLPLYNYDNQAGAHAETVLIQSLLHSLSGLPPVDAVWLFHNNSPWQGNTADWLCPLALPGSGVSYTLYFCMEKAPYHSRQGLDLLTPVQIKLISTGEEEIIDCHFSKIINLLSQDYDPALRAPLPQGIQVLAFTLADHLLLMDLAAPFTGSPEQACAFVGALVYTFTGLPEVDAVMVTVEGQTWESGGIVWAYPLSRDDLEQGMNMSINRSGFSGY